MHLGWKCTTPIELPYAKLGDTPKATLPDLGGGVNALFCGASCWQSVKNCKGLLEMHSFQCIGGGSVRPPPSCHTLGQAMRWKVCHLALAEAWMHFFVAYHVGSVWKSTKVCLNCPVFNALGVAMYYPKWVARRWARRCAKRMLGQGTCLKARRPAFVYANVCLYVFSFIVFIQHFRGKTWGVCCYLHCGAWYAWRGDATNWTC